MLGLVGITTLAIDLCSILSEQESFSQESFSLDFRLWRDENARDIIPRRVDCFRCTMPNLYDER